jgi:FlaA1/EpsC-like NDP-sugar epimerase
MKNKTLAIFGIGTYILSVLSSATDLEGNSVVPIALIAISGIATAIFIIMAIVRLWKEAKGVSIILASSTLILYILAAIQEFTFISYGSPLIILLNTIKVIDLIAFIWAVSLLWKMAKHEGLAKKFLKHYGFTTKGASLIQEDSRKGNHKSDEQRIAVMQERARAEYKESTGVNIQDIIPEVGREISWVDIVNHVFRVMEFDRSDSTIEQNNQVKAKSSFRPYGYLLVESPIMNQKVKLPIIHRDDFLLAASVFDEPKLADLVVDEELLVTYAPKHLLPKGL